MELTILLLAASTVALHPTQIDITTTTETVISCSFNNDPAPPLDVTSVPDDDFAPIDTTSGPPPTEATYPEPVIPGPCLPAVGSSSSPSATLVAGLVSALGTAALFISRRRNRPCMMQTAPTTPRKQGSTK